MFRKRAALCGSGDHFPGIGAANLTPHHVPLHNHPAACWLLLP
jgi:hypothetical protein